MDLYEAIDKRCTIRDFEDRPVPVDVIHRILAAGMKAPTNDHMRSWHFLVFQDEAEKAKLVSHISKTTSPARINDMLDAWQLTDQDQRNVYLDAVPKQQAMILTAGVVILPCFRVTNPLLKPKSLSDLNYFASIWMCIENILLAATSEGVYGVVRIPFERESKAFTTELGVPADYAVPCYIALGYPKAGAVRLKQVEINLDDRIHINHW
jgi:nitroreductase